MTRRHRILLELLGPPFLGSILWDLVWGIVSLADEIPHGFPNGFLQALPAAIFILPFAYVMAGLPSLIYMLIMEWGFAHGLSPTGWRMVWLSSLLGLFSGAAIVLVFDSSLLGLWLVFNGTGFVVGFVLGVLIKVLSARTPPAESKH